MASKSKKSKPPPDHDVMRFTNALANPIPSHTITNLSDADIAELRQGRVPDWLVQATDFYVAVNQGPAAGIAAANEELRRARFEELWMNGHD